MSLNETISAHNALLRNCAGELGHYSRAASALGLGQLAEDLDVIATQIVESGRNVAAAYSEDLSEQLDGARQNVAAVLSSLARS